MDSKKTGAFRDDMPLIPQLGVDVTLEKETLDKDHDASAVFHRIGAAKAEPGMEYVGTIAIHLYLEKVDLTKTEYSMSNITHISMKKDVSEALVATVMNNATIDIRTHFNPSYKFKTNRKNDKRGIIK